MTSPVHLDNLPPGAREVVARLLPYQERRHLARRAPGCMGTKHVPKVVDPAKALRLAKAQETHNKLAGPFRLLWRSLGAVDLVPEFRFHTHRLWRLDFADPFTKLAIELDGGVWSDGRHLRGRGFLEDCEKFNAAALAGWRVFRLGTGMVTAVHVRPIVEAVRTARARLAAEELIHGQLQGERDIP